MTVAEVRVCSTCPTLLEHHVRSDARYCPRCRKKTQRDRARRRGAPWTRPNKKTLDLVDGTIVGTLRDEDYGRFGSLVRRDPCAYCGAPSTDSDHIVPRIKGGTNGWDNRTAACAACNNHKSDRSLLAHLLCREVDAELVRLGTARAILADVGPPRVPAERMESHYTPGRHRNWRAARG